MSETDMPISRQVAWSLASSLLGWASVLVLLAMLNSERHAHYLVAVPPGIPAGGLVYALVGVVLLWAVGAVGGPLALVRIRREGQDRGRAGAWAAVLLGGLPFALALGGL